MFTFGALQTISGGQSVTQTVSVNVLPMSSVTLSMAASGITFLNSGTGTSAVTFTSSGPTTLSFTVTAAPDIATNAALPVAYQLSGNDAALYALPSTTLSVKGNAVGEFFLPCNCDE